MTANMPLSLLDRTGHRKYLTSAERAAFARAALSAEPQVGAFCLTLTYTGARISEVLALTVDRIDVGNRAIVIETLKRREPGVFRAVPVPAALIEHLITVHSVQFAAKISGKSERLWTFSRPTAWKRVKEIMARANVPADIAKPKALRHAFGVEAVQQRIALNLVKKWLGHAKIESTAIYADPIGDEERALARFMWRTLPFALDATRKVV